MKKHFYPIAIFLIIFSLLLYFQPHSLLQHDMVEYAAFAEYKNNEINPALGWYYQPLETTLPWRTGTHYITAYTYKITSLFNINAETTTLLTQYLFGALAAIFLYLFLRELYKKQMPALLATLIFFLSTPLFNAILGKEHGTEFFFCFAAMYFLIKAIKTERFDYSIAASTSLGLALWTKESTLLFPIIFYGFYIIQKKKDALKIKPLLALTIPYLLLALTAFNGYVWNILKVSITNYGNATFFSYTKPILLSLWEHTSLLYITLIAFSIYISIKHKKQTPLFFLAIILLFFTIFTKNSTFDIRQLGIYIFFPLATIICYGITKIKNKHIATALTLIIIIQLFIPSISLYNERKQTLPATTFAQSFQTLPQDAIIFSQRDFCIIWSYYGERECRFLPTNFIETIDPLLKENKKIYVLFHVGFGFYDDNIKELIQNNYNLNPIITAQSENYHHADLKTKHYEEMLVEVTSLS
jgi:hypothetical protein